MSVSNTIRYDIEQIIENEKRDDPGHQTGDDRGWSKSLLEVQAKGNRTDAHKRQSFGRDPYYFAYRHNEFPDVIPVHQRRLIWCMQGKIKLL